MVSLLSDDRNGAAAISLIPDFNLALNGAYLSAQAGGAEQLKVELIGLISMMQAFDTETGRVGEVFLANAADRLARIESQYIELKTSL